MRLPIDTSAVKFAAAGPSEPVLDFATKAQRTDENGVGIFQVPAFAAGSGFKDLITIKVAGGVRGSPLVGVVDRGHGGAPRGHL